MAESMQGPAQARPRAGSVVSFPAVRISDSPARGLQKPLLSKTTRRPLRREPVIRMNAKRKESHSRVDKGLEKLSGSLRSRRCSQGCAFMWREEPSRELEPEVATAALSLVGADGHLGVAKGRASHWPPCLTMRTFKTYSFSSFQIYSTVLLTVVTMVYMASPGLPLSLYLLTTFIHLPGPLLWQSSIRSAYEFGFAFFFFSSLDFTYT